ncbi:hypothetical protein CBR_g49008 [Chara braunii]|uniref:60S acidic ribosomal protein P2 n=1 Tax=Chara braunii TaxID=69332 RepID=A0A388M4B2_CHABU|nr:hypothetical protein CBR_g49008 [Chara braunii]|eukprot:GBG89299.1 hypothetical protein CBR_g49008 [Chara braunii]
MKYVAAYLLAVLGGKAHPTADDIADILESVSADVDHKRLDKLMKELEGKDVNEVIAAGREKFSSVPSGGGAGAASAGGGGGGGGDAAGGAAAAEPEKEPEKEAEEEEEDEDMGFSLFD